MELEAFFLTTAEISVVLIGFVTIFLTFVMSGRNLRPAACPVREEVCIPRTKSKWGRHCCRPHSYRRVVFLSGEPFKKRLALGFYPLQRVGGSFHRRSRRHPVSPFNSVLPVRAEAFSSGAVSSNATETIPPSRSLPSNGWFLPQLPPSSVHNQVPGLSSECASRSSQATALASSLHLLHIQSRRPRGQNPLRRFFEKLS